MKNHLIFLLRVLLCGIFLVSGISKFFDLTGFRNVVSGFHIVSGMAAKSIAVTIPSLEFLSGTLLLFGILIKQASAIVVEQASQNPVNKPRFVLLYV